MGSHHFVGLAGDPVGVAQDLQLHVCLGDTAANQSQVSGQQVNKINYYYFYLILVEFCVQH